MSFHSIKISSPPRDLICTKVVKETSAKKHNVPPDKTFILLWKSNFAWNWENYYSHCFFFFICKNFVKSIQSEIPSLIMQSNFTHGNCGILLPCHHFFAKILWNQLFDKALYSKLIWRKMHGNEFLVFAHTVSRIFL